MSKIIGIDLGTTNSCVSVLENGSPVIIPSAEGNRTVPSVVAFKDGRRLIGESAKRQAVVNKETIFSIKSKMGSTRRTTLGGKKYTPQEISAMILQSLKQQAEAYLGEEVTRAVITVPAYFTDAQRQATKDAGRIAGLRVERIINEPTAAALAYGLDKQKENQTVLVYDLGGGTFDVSILELGDGVFQVLSTAGDNKLGGDNFDDVLSKHLASRFKKETGIDVSKDKTVMRRITETAEKVKKELSTLKESYVSLPFLTAKDGVPYHLETTITREEFNKLTKKLVEKTRGPLLEAIDESGLDLDEIDKVILVGGSTRIPAVVDLVKEVTDKEPFKGVNPDEVVAMGAAVQAGVLSGDVDDVVLVDVTSLSLGIKTADGLFTPIIPRNTPIPATGSKLFTTVKDNQTLVTLHVLQGERRLAEDNKLLGKVQLTDIIPAKGGVPDIEVTFKIDRNGIVSVSAVDKLTGKRQSAVMLSEYGLTESEIEEMIRDAQEHAEEDERLARESDLSNRAQRLLSRTKDTLEEYSEGADNELLTKINSKYQEVEDMLNNNNFSDLPDSISHLRNLVNQLSVRDYEFDYDAVPQLM